MKQLVVFAVLVVVGCVIIAKLTGLHDPDTRGRGPVDDGRILPVAALVKRASKAPADYAHREVAVRGIHAQVNRYETDAHVVIEDGDAQVFCVVAKDYVARPMKTKLVARGVITFVAMTNAANDRESQQVVLGGCKLGFE